MRYGVGARLFLFLRLCLPLPFFSVFIDLLIRSAEFGDNIIDIAAKVAFLVLDNFFFNFIDKNRDLHLNKPRNWDIHILLKILSLAKLLGVGQFGLRNQALEIAYLTYDDISFLSFFEIRTRLVVQSLLNAQISNIPC